MVTGIMQKKMIKFCCTVFKLCMQTDRQTDILITILRNPTAELTDIDDRKSKCTKNMYTPQSHV